MIYSVEVAVLELDVIGDSPRDVESWIVVGEHELRRHFITLYEDQMTAQSPSV